jgi:xylulokinase
MSLLLGLDVSTTATKAVLVDGSGTVVGVGSSAYGLETPRPLWAEQDPNLWTEAAPRSIERALEAAATDASAVEAVGLTGQMHGLVLVDEDGEPLRPAILWNDQRAAAECDEMRERLGLEHLVAITGNDAFPGFTAPKLLWVRNHEPEKYARIHRVLLPKDYLRYFLTGEYATDRAGAGGTLLLDLVSRDWSEELLDAFDLPAEWLPPTHEGTEVTGTVSSEAAELTGLRAGIPVVAGGGDQAAQAVGVGAVRNGVVALTLGTSGVVFASSERPLIESRGRLHAFPHAVPGRWHVMGVMLSAAGSLAWYRDTFAPEIAYDDLMEGAAPIEPGCEGLTFLPYLSGERTPHADPYARAAFVGMTLKHGRDHMTRAVLEGVAFGLRDNLALMGEVGLNAATEVRVSGGGAQSRLWRQILADVLGVDLVTTQTIEGAAYGAALLAGVGIGVWPSVDAACKACVRLGERTRPRREAVAGYGAAYERFGALYRALKPHFRT